MIDTDEIRYHTEVGTGYSKDAQLVRAADEIDRLRAALGALLNALDHQMADPDTLYRAKNSSRAPVGFVPMSPGEYAELRSEICNPQAAVEIGDRVRRYGEIGGPTGTVYDTFAARGETWAQVEWTLRGNQYLGSRTLCKAELERGLVVMVKAKHMRPNASSPPLLGA